MIPGVGRAVWQSGASGGGTGRTTDWSTYDGTNDTAWQQWLDDTSSALGTTYQVINGFKNTALAGSGSFFMGIDNNGTQTIGKWVPDTADTTSAQITLGSFHNLGSNQVQMVDNGAEMVLTSNVDSGSIVVFDQSLTDSGKVSGFVNNLPNSGWDVILVSTDVSSGSSAGAPYDYTNNYWNSKADLIQWYYNANVLRTSTSHAVWLKGTYTKQGSNGSGRDGIKELLTTPSQSPYYSTPYAIDNQFGDTIDDGWDNHTIQVHWMRNHHPADQLIYQSIESWNNLNSRRQVERIFASHKLWDNSSTSTNHLFQMMLPQHYAYNGGGGFGGNGWGPNGPWAETTFRGNSDLQYYKSTGRSINNVNTANMSSMVMGKSMIQLYNDETGTAGGNLYVTAITDTNETASSDLQYLYPTAQSSSHQPGPAEMFIFDEVTTDDTHPSNALIVSNTPAADSTNTAYDPESVCMAPLHQNYFGVAWRQGTTAYVSIFSIDEQTSAMPTITREVDTVNLGTVPNAGRMALSKLGNGVAVLTCGNYYRIIKTDAI